MRVDRIEPVGFGSPIMPIYPILRIKRRKQIEMKKLITIHDDNLGQNVDITISGSVFLPVSKVIYGGIK